MAYRKILTLVSLVLSILVSEYVMGQLEPINNRPNPYSAIDNWVELPDNRNWGSTAGVDIDPDGRHLWAIDRCGENSCAGSNLDPILKIDPNDFARRINTVETMNFFELNEFIEKEKAKGSDNTAFYEIEKHKRFAFPFATFILTLIGVSLASRKVRGGIGLHIGLGLLISFSFILFMQVTITFATNANLSPFLAMWIPNILFGLLAYSLFKLAPK